MNVLVSCLHDPETQETFFPAHVRAELETLSEIGTPGRVRYGVFDRAGLTEALAGAEVLFSGWGMPIMDAELLRNAANLKLVCYTGGSVADFWTEEAVSRGIRICSGNRLYAESVAEGTICYMLLSQRRLPKIIGEMRETGWAKQYYTDGLRYKTVGIYGFGMIARALIPKLQSFGCRVKVFSDWYTETEQAAFGAEKCSSLEELFSTSDIVTLHEAMRNDTYHAVDARLFSLMREDALFVNTARGSLIVENDLADAVRSGHIRAVLDVYEREPLPMDSPLRNLEGCILIPHHGGPTVDLRAYVTLALIEDAKRFAAGEVLEHELPWSYAKNMTKKM